MHDAPRARGTAAARVVAAAAVFAVASLADVAQASGDTVMGDFTIPLFVFLAVGGVACGAVIVLPLLCLTWRTLAMDVQPRESRMWETAPSSEMSASKQALLRKLTLDKLYPKKAKSHGKGGAGEAATTPTSAASGANQQQREAMSRYNSAYSPAFQANSKRAGA